MMWVAHKSAFSKDGSAPVGASYGTDSSSQMVMVRGNETDAREQAASMLGCEPYQVVLERYE